MRILGIDPALNNTGWACIEKQKDNSIKLVGIGHISNPISNDYYSKLNHIRENILEIIEKTNPDILSIEETFVNNNAISSLKLGVVRGVIMSVALQNNIKILEFKPNEIKKVITGNGKADKIQVDYMVKILIPKANPKTLDESDALAIAITGSY